MPALDRHLVMFGRELGRDDARRGVVRPREQLSTAAMRAAYDAANVAEKKRVQR